MKILMLHLSDLHINGQSYSEDQFIDPIISALAELPKFDRAIIVFSGDVAFSGKADEYLHAEHFMGKLITKIKRRYLQDRVVNTVIVPGNHDIDFGGISRSRSDMAKVRKEERKMDQLREDTQKMRNFFNFAKSNRVFKNSKLVEPVVFDFDGYKIQFNLVNSAPFSIFNDPNDDNDQSLHYLPIEEINKLEKKSEASACFTVMHHSPSWFDYNSQQALRHIISIDSSALFVGHDHIQHAEFVNVDGTNDCLIIRGGSIDPNKSGEFNCILLDTDTSTYTTYDCISENCEVYTVTKQQEIQVERGYIHGGFQIKKEYLTKLNSANIVGKNIGETIIFPRLIQFGENVEEGFIEEKKLETYEEFENSIQNKQVCLIEGAGLSGKTQLLKYIYLQYFDKKLPLYIDADNFPKNSTINNIIKQAFAEQYSDKMMEFSKYMQLPRAEKIILVDNIHRLKDPDSLIDKLHESYSQVICTLMIAPKVDIRDMLFEASQSEEVCRFRIENFYYEKRMALINKACHVLHSDLSELELQHKASELNSFIEKQLSLFNITPHFILNYCLNDALRAHGDSNDMNAFGEVFKANLVKAFEVSSKIKVDTAFFILGDIAYYIMAQKEYPLTIERFDSLVRNYNEEYGQSVNPNNFLNDLLEAQIIQFVDETKIKFCSLNILAYFAGKSISDVKGTLGGQTLIKSLVKNICFGINAEVLQFVIAFNNDNSLLDMLMEEINSYFVDLEEFSFDKNNLPYLCKSSAELQLVAPNQNIKKEEVDRIEKHEKKVASHNIDIIDIFDYSEADLERFVNKQIRLRKLGILTAQLYSNFYYIIPIKDKEKYVQAIYSQPNQIIYYVLRPFAMDFNAMIDEVYNDLQQENCSLTKDQLVKLTIAISEDVILNTYDYTARNCGTSETITSLNNYATDSNTNYKILLTMIYENMGNLKTFGQMAEKITDNSKYKIIKEMMGRVVYKHFTWNDVQMIGYGEHLAEKFFGQNKKVMKLIHSKGIRQKK